MLRSGIALGRLSDPLASRLARLIYPDDLLRRLGLNSQTLIDQPPTLVDAVSIDCTLFGFDKGVLKVLLVKHADGICKGQWALPGGWVCEAESLDAAAERLLFSLTGIRTLYLEQLRAFGRVDRYPLRRVITVAFTALVRPEDYALVAGAAASDAYWCELDKCPPLVFDHAEILQSALASLRHKLRHEPVGFNLLPEKFTLFQLQSLYEAILCVKLDKPNFRRKMMNMKLLVPCNEKQASVAHRAAALYRFDEAVYQSLQRQGFTFEI
jgi:8-oxo-dGTP diphosphatase